MSDKNLREVIVAFIVVFCLCVISFGLYQSVWSEPFHYSGKFPEITQPTRFGMFMNGASDGASIAGGKYESRLAGVA